MDLTTDQKLAINMKVARDMWPDAHVEAYTWCGDAAYVIPNGIKLNIFDPDNTTDLNKAVEFYKLDVYLRETNDGTLPNWVCESFYGTIRAHSKSRDSAIVKAITAASGVTL